MFTSHSIVADPDVRVLLRHYRSHVSMKLAACCVERTLIRCFVFPSTSQRSYARHGNGVEVLQDCKPYTVSLHAVCCTSTLPARIDLGVEIDRNGWVLSTHEHMSTVPHQTCLSITVYRQRTHHKDVGARVWVYTISIVAVDRVCCDLQPTHHHTVARVPAAVIRQPR